MNVPQTQAAQPLRDASGSRPSSGRRTADIGVRRTVGAFARWHRGDPRAQDVLQLQGLLGNAGVTALLRQADRARLDREPKTPGSPGGPAPDPLMPNPATQARLTEIITQGGPMPADTRVVGAAIIEVDGYTGPRELRAISGAATDALVQGAPVTHALTPASRTVTAARGIGGFWLRGEFPWSHINDAEIKLFEYIAARMPEGATGRVSIMTVRTRQGGQVLEPIPACSSCTNASFEIAGEFGPGVTLGSYAPVHPTGTLDLGGSDTPSGGGTGGGTAATTFTGGQRITAAAVLAAMAANAAFNAIIRYQNERDIQDALEARERDLQAEQASDPTLGFVFRFRFVGAVDSGEGPTAEGRFRGLTYASGHSEEEARAKLSEGDYTSATLQYLWVPPLIPRAAGGRWQTAGLAEFADWEHIEFRRLKFGALRGFTLGGSYRETMRENARERVLGLRFFVLEPPDEIRYRKGRGDIGSDSLEIEERPVVGGRVKAIIVQGEPVVPVIAADAFTARFFRAAKQLELLEFSEVAEDNIQDIRWLPPEQVEMVDTPLKREHLREAERDRVAKERLEEELEGYRQALHPATVFAIHDSVGENGRNDPADLKRVSHRLHELGFLDDETVDADAVADAIYDYQYQVLRIPKPDGRVDPAGTTAAALRAGRKRSMALP